MTTEDRLKRYEQRQERIIGSLAVLADLLQAQQAAIAEVVELLKQPVSTDLPDLLRVLIAKIEALPEIVARAVKIGEIK